MSTATLAEFLNARRVTKEDPSWTFTGMASPHLGKFAISTDEYKQFLTLYHKHVFKQKQHASLLERHATDGGPLLIDLDFRFPHTEPVCRQYTREQINVFLSVYAAAVHRFIQVSDFSSLRFFLQEIPEPLSTANKGVPLTKDGVHIVCPDIHLSFVDQFALRAYVLKQRAIETAFPGLVNSASDCLDESVIQRNNWFLYGSSKNADRPAYTVTACFTLASDGTFRETTIETETMKPRHYLWIYGLWFAKK